MSFGQIDTTLVLPAAEVQGAFLRDGVVGTTSQDFQKTDIEQDASNSLASLLDQQSNVFIKSYGLGSIATSSIRGGSAGHTAVLWNGFSIQSPMLGLLDLSLIPSFFTDQASLQYGGNSAGWGNGAIGGIISLENKAPEKIHFQVEAKGIFGSFGYQHQSLKLSYGKGTISGTTRIFRQEAENNFKYSIRPDLPEREQSNAAFEQNGILQELYWSPKANQQVTFRAWVQNSDREIPPTTTQSRSEASQKDDIYRGTIHWKQINDRSVFKVKAGFFRENIDYTDPLIGLRAKSHFWSQISEVEGQWELNDKQKLQIGVNSNYTEAFAEEYGNTATEHRLAVFGSFRQKVKQVQFQLNLRQGIVDNTLLPFIPSLGFDYAPFPWLTIKGKVSRNFRLPTLNDRFWIPGGNPDLKAESGWSEELGVHLVKKEQGKSLEYNVTAFNRVIDNWILWSIQEGQSFWSATNIAKVWSRGLEQRIIFKKTWSNVQLQIRGGYDYVLSTNQISLSQPRIEKGMQLFYVPKHQAFASIGLRTGQFSCTYRHRYDGGINTLNEPLDGYQLGSLYIQYGLSNRRIGGTVFLNLENLWDTNYRVIERRAMPGRHFRIGIKFHFQKNQK